MTRIPETISQLKHQLLEFTGSLSKPQTRVFLGFIIGLLVSHFNGSISRLSRQPFVSLSKHQLNHFLSRGQVSEGRLHEIIGQMIDTIASRIRRKSAFLIIDDTLAKKTGKKIEGVEWYYEHVNNVFQWGHCIVLGILVVGGLRLPVEVELMIKKRDTRYSLFRRIFQCVSMHWQGRLTVLADAFYAGYGLMHRIEAEGRRYVIQIRSQYVFMIDGREWKVRNYVKNRKPREKIEIRGKTYRVGDVTVFREGVMYRLVYSRNKHGNWSYYLTNNFRSTASQILRDYSVRWEIETFIQEVKGNLGFADSHLRTRESIVKYWQIVFLTYLSVVWLRLITGMQKTFGQMMEWFANSFIQWIVLNKNFKLPMCTSLKPALENEFFYKT